MVKKTKKVHLGALQVPTKFQQNQKKIEILNFDPCFKKHASNYFWDTLQVQNILKLNCQYEIGIVPKFGAPQITLEDSAKQNPKGGWNPPPLGKVGLSLSFLTKSYLILWAYELEPDAEFYREVICTIGNISPERKPTDITDKIQSGGFMIISLKILQL